MAVYSNCHQCHRPISGGDQFFELVPREVDASGDDSDTTDEAWILCSKRCLRACIPRLDTPKRGQTRQHCPANRARERGNAGMGRLIKVTAEVWLDSDRIFPADLCWDASEDKREDAEEIVRSRLEEASGAISLTIKTCWARKQPPQTEGRTNG